MEKRLKQKYRITTPNDEIVYTKPGKNGEYDMKIFTEFPYMPWPHSLYYIGVCLRLKSMVEDRNYPNGRGKHMLLHFCQECILNKNKTIKEICEDFKIKL
jgi:hypothetical protein